MLRKLLPSGVRRNLGMVRDAAISQVFAALAVRRLKYPRHGCPHGLPGELIVSLTSYPARFGTLHLSIACLLDQSVKADRTILWIAHEDIGKLPAKVRRLKCRGLEIRACEDVRSYKKLIPALEAFPEAFIVTADDDIFFPHNWLEVLTRTPERGVIACHRAHRLKRLKNGALRPYLEWQIDVQDADARRASDDVFPTGGAGALYPPHSLDPSVTDRALFERLCPDGDDLWFYWCARIAGTLNKKVGGKMRLVPWPGSQACTLWSYNEAGGNDRMIDGLQQEFPINS